jgi:phytoene dehydrogenase-like protein
MALATKRALYDPTLAPKGKSVVECLITINDFSYWEKLYVDRNAYRLEKERIAEAVAGELEHKYPGFQSAIEVTDVVTPMTYVRYTGNWKGTYMTWIIPPDKAKKFQMIKKTKDTSRLQPQHFERLNVQAIRLSLLNQYVSWIR